jgi:hypothetical protein
MIESFHPRFLEVEITPTPPRWHWRVFAGDDELSNGSEDGQLKATFEGYGAMFRLLAAGWNP